MRSELTVSPALLPPGSRVLCAVSGGADSVCLLSLCRERGDLTVLCAHYDHGIRGEEARGDAAFTETLCREWGIPFFLGQGDIPRLSAAEGLGTEECARKHRYEFLFRTAEETGADYIATAHTMNDNAETVLLHLARGTGLRGLSGIPVQRGRLVRPLLDVTRAQVEAYLQERGLPWREDSTNQSDAYARNRARHHVLPQMEALHPGAAEAIHRMTKNAAEDEEYLASLAERFLSEQGETLSCDAVLALPRCVARRVFRLWTGRELSREHTEALLRLCGGGCESAALDLPGGRVLRQYGRLSMSEGEPEKLPPREIPPEGELLLPEAGLKLICTVPETGEIQKSFTTFFFACEKICGKLSVTSRMDGDRLSLPWRTGTHTLKNLFSEKRIPASRRDTVPVIRDEQGILAVYGIGQTGRARPQPGERYVRIEIKEI